MISLLFLGILCVICSCSFPSAFYDQSRNVIENSQICKSIMIAYNTSNFHSFIRQPKINEWKFCGPQSIRNIRSTIFILMDVDCIVLLHESKVSLESLWYYYIFFSLPTKHLMKFHYEKSHSHSHSLSHYFFLLVHSRPLHYFISNYVQREKKRVNTIQQWKRRESDFLAFF